MNLYGFADGDPVNNSDPFGLCPMCIIGAAWALYELGSTAYDVYQAAKTLRDPNASRVEKTAMVAAAAYGIFGPGGGGTAVVKGGSALLDAATAADKAFITAERMGHIVERHAFGSAAKDAGKFTKGADIAGLISQALKSDATLIKPGGGGRYVFEHTFNRAIGMTREGSISTSLRVVLDRSGKVITAFPF